MERKNRITTLFNRLLGNSISKQELHELLEYLKDPKSSEHVKMMMQKHWEEVKDVVSPGVADFQSNKRFSDILEKSGMRKSGSDKFAVHSSISRLRILRRIAAAAAVLVLISMSAYWIFEMGGSSNTPVAEQLATTQYTGKQAVNLPDGSVVILNEGSQLSFTEAFGKEKREISFSGEGYFDIVPDSDRPFVVHTGRVTTTVLGTAFNLTAYEDQPEISVTVEHGEVAVGEVDKIYDKIRPKEQIRVDKKTRSYEKEMADLSKVLAWKEDFLILTETTIEEAAELIGARYHVEVSVQNEALKKCTMNAAFMYGESLEQVLRVVTGVLQADFTINDHKVEIIGGRKCN